MSVSVVWNSVGDDGKHFISEKCHIVLEWKGKFQTRQERYNLYNIQELEITTPFLAESSFSAQPSLCSKKIKVINVPFAFFHHELKVQFPNVVAISLKNEQQLKQLEQLKQLKQLKQVNELKQEQLLAKDLAEKQFQLSSSSSSSSPPSSVIFRDHQTKVIQRSVEILSTNQQKQRQENNKSCKSVVLNCQPGFGKTVCSVEISRICQANKICVVILQKCLETQWEQAFSKINPNLSVVINSKCKQQTKKRKLKKQVLTEQEKVLADLALAKKEEEEQQQQLIFGCFPYFDVFVVNIAVIDRLDRKHPGFFSMFDFLIADEVHCLMTRNHFSSLLLFNNVTKCLALSATPKRYDAFHKAIHMFFGNEKDNFVGNFKPDDFDVFVIDTQWKPDNHLINNKGTKKRLDWTKIIHNQSTSMERNAIVARAIACMYNRKRDILVLVKLKDQGYILQNMLLSLNIHSVCFFGNTISSDAVRQNPTSSRVLIATIKKVGTGFDLDRLDTLVVAVDCSNYFQQYFGRILRKPTNDRIRKPIVVDFRDDFFVLRQHLDTRFMDYLQYGGKIKKWKIEEEQN